MDWNALKALVMRPYIIGPAIFIIWLILAYLVKSLIVRKLLKVFKRRGSSVGIILVKAFSMPMNVIIIFLGFSLVWKFLTLNPTFEYYMNLLTIFMVILSVTMFADRFTYFLMVEYDTRSTHIKLSHGILHGLIRILIYILGALIMLSNIGISISPLLASLGIGTLAVALALQSTFANFFSGLFVMLDKSISVGDFVQLETGEAGYVDEIGWRASRIRLLTNNHVIIPNSKLVDSIVTNYQAPVPKMYILITAGVHYDSDLEQVERVVLDVAREVIKDIDGTIKEEEPDLWFREFGDSSITFRLRIACRDFVSQFQIQHELVKRIHKRFAQEGIVIPFPLRTLDFQPKHIQMFRELAGKEAR